MAAEQGTENTEDFHRTVDRRDGKGRREEIDLIFLYFKKALVVQRAFLNLWLGGKTP